MQIYLNGQLVETACSTLFELIQDLALENKRFAVEYNAQIVPKSKLALYTLAEQDQIEIIHAVGGG